MGRHTGNEKVVKNLQKALQAFLADHYKAAHEDPEWIEEAKDLTPEEREKFRDVVRSRWGGAEGGTGGSKEPA